MIGKVDQLMPMLETLVIDNVITQRDLDLQKALFKKMIKTVASEARVFAGGLRRRMNAMDQNREVAAIDDEQTTADQPQPASLGRNWSLAMPIRCSRGIARALLYRARFRRNGCAGAEMKIAF
jgi:hypothetical protein